MPAIAKEVSDICWEGDDGNSQNDEGGARKYVRATAAEAAGAAVTEVADERLNEEARERATEPYDTSPRVGYAEFLHVRGQ